MAAVDLLIDVHAIGSRNQEASNTSLRGPLSNNTLLVPVGKDAHLSAKDSSFPRLVLPHYSLISAYFSVSLVSIEVLPK